MIESAVYAFRACTSSKVYAKIGRAFLFEFISLSVSSIDFRVAFIQRRGPLDMLISVSQVLIIPNVVIIVTFNVGCLLFKFRNLPPRRFLHPLMDLQTFLVFEELEFSLLLEL